MSLNFEPFKITNPTTKLETSRHFFYLIPRRTCLISEGEILSHWDFQLLMVW